jgi:hypothetical protein
MSLARGGVVGRVKRGAEGAATTTEGFMKYLLTIYNDESGFAEATPEDIQQVMAAYDAFSREVSEAGAMLGGEGLSPSSTATTVQVRDGQTLTSDGPFADTREQLGGYYLLECRDLDEAIGWAAKIPGAQNGTIEVRPVMDYEAAGAETDAQTHEGAR